jgi:hypothetical protein
MPEWLPHAQLLRDLCVQNKSPRRTPCMQMNGSVEGPATGGVNSITHRFGTCLKTCVGRGRTTELQSRQNDKRETVQRWKVEQSILLNQHAGILLHHIP